MIRLVNIIVALSVRLLHRTQDVVISACIAQTATLANQVNLAAKCRRLETKSLWCVSRVSKQQKKE